MTKICRWLVVVIALFSVTQVRAQNPIFAGHGPVIEAGLGYSYANVGVPSLDRVSMHGVDGSVNADFSRRFGVKLDVGYVRGFDVFGTNHHADILSYMAGPVFYPIRKKRFSVYTEALFGGARETGVNFTSSGQTITGFTNKFAWQAGGGVEYRISRMFAVRFGADYMHTSFYNSEVTITGQNNVRAVASLVYTFGEGREK
jgi:opacity protein-like surface antigen